MLSNRVLDVAAGTGALALAAARTGAQVLATDFSPGMVDRIAAYGLPNVETRVMDGQALALADATFDAVFSIFGVIMFPDWRKGLAEMARVTRNGGGVVCACVWDHGGDQSPLTPFWQAVRELEPGADAEADLAGTREGQLTELFREAGLREVEDTALTVHLEHATFEDWWEPFTLGVGPAGVYYASLDATKQAEVREACKRRLPEPPFTLSARAWTARGEPAN